MLLLLRSDLGDDKGLLFVLLVVVEVGTVVIADLAGDATPVLPDGEVLAISLSRDGLTFDRMAVIRFVAPNTRYEGRSKAVGYAYPHSAIVGDHLWVIYSVNKEDIEIARTPLSELEALK